MKYIVILVLQTIYCSTLLAQTSAYEPEYYQTTYEKDIVLKKDASYLESLMAIGPSASEARTAAVKQELDAFIYEIKSSKLMHASEVKLMKELHKKVHERFLTQYKTVSPFPDIFVNGQYNCVSATALFTLVLEGLDIPYAIQEIPTHVYVVAYPDTKAISVEMTALNDAYYMPARKDISRAVGILVELELTTKEEILRDGPTTIYSRFYNTNKVISLKQLAGLQYYNNAIVAADAELYEKAYNEISKADKLYGEKKVLYFKTELLYDLLSTAKFNRMQDIAYLVAYANLKKGDQTSVVSQYAKFLHENVILQSNKVLVDSSHTYIVSHINDSLLLRKLNGFYYLGLSEFYANAYNLKKKMQYAELAYTNAHEIPGIQLWLADCILETMEDEGGLEWVQKLDDYATKYPYLRRHNLFLKDYFYACSEASEDYYDENDGENGKLYFDRAIQVMETMEDDGVLDQDAIGWLYAEAGSYLARQHKYEESLRILEKGLEASPGHERILARIEIVKDRMKQK